VVLLARVFAPGAAQLAHERAKLARLSFNAGESAAVAELDAAARAMELCCGVGRAEVVELRRLEHLARM